MVTGRLSVIDHNEKKWHLDEHFPIGNRLKK